MRVADAARGNCRDAVCSSGQLEVMRDFVTWEQSLHIQCCTVYHSSLNVLILIPRLFKSMLAQRAVISLFSHSFGNADNECTWRASLFFHSPAVPTQAPEIQLEDNNPDQDCFHDNTSDDDLVEARFAATAPTSASLPKISLFPEEMFLFPSRSCFLVRRLTSRCLRPCRVLLHL